MNVKRARVWIGWAAAAAVGIALVVVARRPEPVGVDTARAARGPLRVTVDQEGRTRLRERYVVSSPLAGRLRRLPVKAGDPVRAGETVIATIEPPAAPLLDPRARAQAEARLRAAEEACATADAQLARARAADELARRDAERARRIFESGGLSAQDRDRADLAARVAAEDLRAAVHAVNIAGFEREQARAMLQAAEPAAGGGPAPVELRAPVSGRVLRVFQESETLLPAGAPLLELGDPADLEIVAEVRSDDAVRIAPGAPVALEHWGGGAALEARVRLVEPSAFTKLSALGVEEQRVNVIADLQTPPERRAALGDGYRVEARILVWENLDALKIPAGALFRLGEAWAVYAIEGDRAARREVLVGESNGVETEILEGLKAGDEVILHPGDRLSDGVAIRRRPAGM